MKSTKKSQPTENQIAQIKAEVKQAAIDHLNASDAQTALSHFTDDVIAISNTRYFPSFEALTEDVKAYYNILKEVNLAMMDEIHINVIKVVTAKVRFSFTATSDEKTDLQGVWTSGYVRTEKG